MTINNEKLKKVLKNIAMVIAFAVMTIAVMGLSGELYENWNFDRGIIDGIVKSAKEITDDDGYCELALVVSLYYTYVRLFKNVLKLFARKEEKKDH